MALPNHLTEQSRFVFALLIGAAGGTVFNAFALPLAWMLGSMAAVGAAAIMGLPIAGSKPARPPMSAIIGAMLGTQFGPHLIADMINWWPALIGLAVYLLIAATLVYWYLVKIVGLDPATGYFSAMPGGLVDMVLLGAERGGDERTIALMHSSRVFLVVFCIPPLITLTTGAQAGSGNATNYVALSEMMPVDAMWFLAAIIVGVGFGRLVHLPAPYILGPMIVSGTLHFAGVSNFVVPTFIISAAQVVLGTLIGCRFVGTAPKEILRIMLMSGGSTLILLIVALTMSYALRFEIDIPIEGIFLAFSPGGLPEMSLVALALNIEVSFVALCHISRIAMIVLGATLLSRLRS